jgi:hypothetical protein
MLSSTKPFLQRIALCTLKFQTAETCELSTLRSGAGCHVNFAAMIHSAERVEAS